METVPPSYQSATARDAWSIIAQYIPSSDLCAVTLVCRRWHEIFMPVLWGNPASHFGTENDDVYVALTRFRRTLKYARLEVRMLTHTLHMPPALSEIYGGPRPEWLREILTYLPCLQSLIVSELPFFDHNAMVALRGPARFGQSLSEVASRTYNVHLLLAQREPNTTSQGITEALIRFPELIYLDLSYTTPARDQIVLSALSQLERLQVLKLRGIGLKDNDAEFLANAIGHRVRLLDLRDNRLTDMAVRSLLQTCFLPPGHVMFDQRLNSRSFPPFSALDPYSPTFPRSKFLRSPMLDEEFQKALTRPLSGRSWVEDLPKVGITHLYIADNQITVEGVASLLASTQLHVLDVGTVDTAKYIDKETVTLATSRAKQQKLPGAEKLIPILGTLAKKNLTYFRAHHSICTSPAPQTYPTTADCFLSELPADNATAGFSELDPRCEILELPGDMTPVFELPGSTPDILWPNAPSQVLNGGRRNSTYDTEPALARRRGSAFAPEVLYGPEGANDDSPAWNLESVTQPRTLLRRAGSGLSRSDRRHRYSSPTTPLCNSPVATEDSRARKVQELLAKRTPAQYPRRDGAGSFIPYLHPSHVPHLETLILTDVPSHVPPDSPILESLIRFITACSNEALLSVLQAGSDYSLPPGQDRARAEQERAKSLFDLRRLVLEITPVTKSPGPEKSTAWKPVSAQIGPQKSSTGDRDLEQLWYAAMDDFSFFSETECGIPENNPSSQFPMAALNDKISLTPDADDADRQGIPELEACFPENLSVPNRRATPQRNYSPHHSRNPSPISQPPAPAEIDLVAELASFRRRKKGEYEQVVRDSYQRRSMNETLSHSQPRLSTGSASASRTASPSPVSANTSNSIPAPPLFIAHHVEGHWKGEVKIVRNAAPKGRSGMVDMYGNYFEKGYLYP